jgi:hypothetical protein
MAISFKVTGNYSKTKTFLENAKEVVGKGDFHKYGRMGVDALKSATPVDTGLTAESWKYRIVHYRSGVSIEWYNTNVVNGVSVAVLLQYGHATRNGYFVEGVDYINPALKPIFDQIAIDAWGEVTRG